MKRTVTLPCEIGDTVWGIIVRHRKRIPVEGTVNHMYYVREGGKMKLVIVIRHLCCGEWGKAVFPSREKAEAAIRRHL